MTLWVSSSAKDLADSLLFHDPQQRATVYGALKSEWILNELDDLQTLYQIRIAPNEA